ncbi:MAG: hypothetical protein RIR52_1206, partial [Acidobacteriota bacterium]
IKLTDKLRQSHHHLGVPLLGKVRLDEPGLPDSGG